MPTESGAETQGQGPEQTVSRQEAEVRTAGRAIAEAAVAKAPDRSDPPSRLDQAVAIHKGLLTDEPQFGIFGESKITFPSMKPTIGNDEYDLAQGETFLAGVHGTIDNGDLKCSFRDNDGQIIRTADGKILLVPLQREDVIDASIFASKDDLGTFVDAEDTELFNRYTKSLPQNERPVKPSPDTDYLVEKAAERHNMLKVADVQKFVDTLTPDQKANPDLEEAMSQLKEGKLVTTDQFADIVEIAGHDQLSLSEDIDALDKEIGTLSEEVEGLADDNPDKKTKRVEIAAAEKKKEALEKAEHVVIEKVTKQAENDAKREAADEAEREKYQTLDADQEIRDRIVSLQKELDQANKDKAEGYDKLDVAGKKKLNDKIRSLTGQIGMLEFGDRAVGKAGAIGTFIALQNAYDNAGPFEKPKYKALQEGIKPQLDASKQVLLDLVNDSDASEKHKRAMRKALEGDSNAGELTALLANEEIAKIDGFNEAVFGEQHDGKAIDAAVEKIAIGAGLDDETREQLRNKLLKRGAWAALIALIVAVGPSLAVITFAAQGMNQNRAA